jgi:hypothetical protein
MGNLDTDWNGRYLHWFDWQITNSTEDKLATGVTGAVASPSTLLTMGRIDVRLAQTFIPDWRASGFLPSPLEVETLEVSDISFSYNIDDRTTDLQQLQQKIEQEASRLLRERLNASAANVQQLFIVQRLVLHNFAISARSEEFPEKSRDFGMRDVHLDNIGVVERGITAAEVAEQIVRVVADEVRKQAEIQGVNIERRKPVVYKKPVSVRDRKESDDLDKNEKSADEKEGGGVKKAFESVGRGIGNVGRGIGNGFKKLFKKE